MTQSEMRAAQLAEIAGVFKGHFSELLKGTKHKPSIETRKKVADVICVSLEWLYDGESSPPLPARPIHDPNVLNGDTPPYRFTPMPSNLSPKALAGSSAEYLERIAIALEKLVEIEEKKSRKL